MTKLHEIDRRDDIMNDGWKNLKSINSTLNKTNNYSFNIFKVNILDFLFCSFKMICT